MIIMFKDFFESWKYLKNNSIVKTKKGINVFEKCLFVDVQKVNPLTGEIDDNEKLNKKTEVWLEFGGWDDEDNIPIHDIDLDCGADTFEEAIIKLANLVYEKYK